MGTLIKENLAKIGMDVTLQPIEPGLVSEKLQTTRDFDAIILGWQSQVPPDPIIGKNVLLPSGNTYYAFPSQTEPLTEWERRLQELVTLNSRQINLCRPPAILLGSDEDMVGLLAGDRADRRPTISSGQRTDSAISSRRRSLISCSGTSTSFTSLNRIQESGVRSQNVEFILTSDSYSARAVELMRHGLLYYEDFSAQKTARLDPAPDRCHFHNTVAAGRKPRQLSEHAYGEPHGFQRVDRAAQERV